MILSLIWGSRTGGLSEPQQTAVALKPLEAPFQIVSNCYHSPTLKSIRRTDRVLDLKEAGAILLALSNSGLAGFEFMSLRILGMRIDASSSS
jgi:hypothetical protein